MNKLKQWGGYVVAGVVGLVGILLYFLSLKNKQVNALKAKVALSTTEKETDVLEAEIRAHRENNAKLAKERKELDKALKELDNKRAEIKDKAKSLTDPKEVAEYWEKN